MYNKKRILTEKTGNNSFAWEERMRKYEASPTLTIPSLIDGTLDDVMEGDNIVFEEVADGVLRSCRGLQHFIRLRGFRVKDREYPLPEIIIFDNHNHALYFWIDAVRRGLVDSGFELIHIDEHSDLWPNESSLDLQRALEDEEYTWQFTNIECNVGNYIVPARDTGLIGNMIRIENEYQFDDYQEYVPSKNSVFNLDMDIFSPELDHIPESKKIDFIINILHRVQYVTIATSPFFIEQNRAITMLRKILRSC